ncbi:hypothetical protein ACIGCM_14100 [Pseudomonas sp. NPDC078700]|uniref:hypothetical protein n=1 Tax=Pseudomonas sp. NPDC078700 TaxID=3364424 RepID=UPI0037CBE0D1
MKHLILLLSLLLPWPVLAAEPTVLVDSRLVPDKQVLVGGTIKYQVDVLVDTWLTSAPQLPPLKLPGAIVSEPSSEATNLTQQRQGKTFFGLRFNYQITPQQAQKFDIPALSFQIQPGQASQPQQVQTQALSFSAAQPAGTPDGGHALIAESLEYSQTLVRSHDPLRVGDSISRQLSVRAVGAQAMLIPTPQHNEIEGLKQYVQTPDIQPLGNGRGDITGGMRNDTLTYVVSEPGNYTLPALELKWWDQTGQAHTASVPEVSFKAQAQNAYSGPFSISEDLRKLGQNTQLHIARHWLLLTGLLLCAALLGFFGRPYWQRGLQLFKQQRAARQQAWQASPEYAWRQLKAKLNDQSVPYNELYIWLKRSANVGTVQDACEQLPSHLSNPLLTLINKPYAPAKTALDSAAEQKQLLIKVRAEFNKSQSSALTDGALKPLNPEH